MIEAVGYYRDFKNAEYLFVHGVLSGLKCITARSGVPAHQAYLRRIGFSAQPGDATLFTLNCSDP